MRSPRLLSEFCDYFLLDAHKKTVSPEEAHHSLDSAVTMYSYLEERTTLTSTTSARWRTGCCMIRRSGRSRRISSS